MTKDSKVVHDETLHELIKAGLQIKEPLFIEKIIFSSDEGEVHVHIDFRPNAKFACSECSKEGLSASGTDNKTWQHLNFFQYTCFIHMNAPKTKCPECGVRTWIPLWAREHSGFTMMP